MEEREPLRLTFELPAQALDQAARLLEAVRLLLEAGQTRGAIRSQVIVELENKLRAEIIDSYGEVTASVYEEDPTVCLVEFSFAVAHGLNQIYLTAHITI